MEPGHDAQAAQSEFLDHWDEYIALSDRCEKELPRRQSVDHDIAVAIMFSDSKMLRWLVGGGINPASTGTDGTRNIVQAGRTGDPELVEILLEAGATLIDRDLYDVTPTERDVVELFVAHGAKPSFVADGKYTALHAAIVSGEKDAEMICQLAPSIIDLPPDNSPLAYAGSTHRFDAAKMLLQRGANVGLAITHPGFSGCSSDFKKLISAAAAEPWTEANHRRFGPSASQVIMTVFLCAKRRHLFLPPELWLIVFRHFVRGDFVLK